MAYIYKIRKTHPELSDMTVQYTGTEFRFAMRGKQFATIEADTWLDADQDAAAAMLLQALDLRRGYGDW
jgi:hypothetical protein